MRTMMNQAQQQSLQAIGSVLSPKQIARFQQIILQAKGPMAVTEEELQNALKVMPLQREQMAMIMQEMETKQQQTGNARRELFTTAVQQAREAQQNEDGDNNDRNRRRMPQLDPETQAKMDQLQAQTQSYEKEALSKIGKVLTSRQKSDYNKLLGAKFDFSSLDMRNVGRGGFGGDRGGRGGGGNRGGR